MKSLILLACLKPRIVGRGGKKILDFYSDLVGLSLHIKLENGMSGCGSVDPQSQRKTRKIHKFKGVPLEKTGNDNPRGKAEFLQGEKFRTER